jgi:hypothetical protein
MIGESISYTSLKENADMIKIYIVVLCVMASCNAWSLRKQ